MTKARISYKMFFAFTVIIVVPVLAIAFILAELSGSVERVREDERCGYARDYLIRRVADRQNYLAGQLKLLARDERALLPEEAPGACPSVNRMAALAAEYGLDGLGLRPLNAVQVRWVKPALASRGVPVPESAGVWADSGGIRVARTEESPGGVLVTGLVSVPLEELFMLRDTLGMDFELVAKGAPEGAAPVMSTRPGLTPQDRSACPSPEPGQPLGSPVVLSSGGARYTLRELALPGSLASSYAAYLAIGLKSGGLTETAAYLLTVSLATLFLAAAASFLLSRQIVRPLGVLSGAVEGLSQRLEKGQPFQPISVEGSDEIAELTRAYNNMGRHLAEAHQSLVERNEDLRRMDKVKDDFLAEIANEIRMPLVSMVALVESLEPSAGPSQRKTLALAARTGRRLHSMVDDILDFSRLEHDEVRLSLRDFKLRPLVDSVLHFCGSIKKPGVELINVVDPGLSVRADQSRVEQMLYHLAGNGVRYTESGTVIVRAWEEGGRVYVSVRDTGPGLPPELARGIRMQGRDPTGLLESERGEGAGAGLGTGLRLVCKLARLHGGCLEPASPLDGAVAADGAQPRSEAEPVSAARGAELVFSLPASSAEEASAGFSLEEPADADPAEELELADGQGDGLPRQRYRILLVDDDPVSIRLALNGLGDRHELRVCGDGTEAYRYLSEEGAPDLAIVASVLHMMSGFELCAMLRREYPAVPVILTMPQLRSEDVSQAYASGAIDYLLKPLSIIELRARVSMHLSMAVLRSSYGKFIPRAALSHMGKDDPANAALGDRAQTVAGVLAADLEPLLGAAGGDEARLELLNRFYRAVGPLVSERGGFIDHYGAGAFIAVFPRGERDVVDAALALRRALPGLAADSGLDPAAADLALGLHRGSALVATVGEAERFECAVISEAVRAARAFGREALAFGAGIVLSGDVLEAVDGSDSRLPVRYLGRGTDLACPLYELLVPDEGDKAMAKFKAQARFERAVAFYEAGRLDEAYAAFTELAASCPDDSAWRVYMERILASRGLTGR